LHAVRSGQTGASTKLMELVYRDLRRLAGHYMRSERSGHTLQPTAVVHEAFFRIFGSRPVNWQDRTHFFAVAARQMRRVLVDHARKKNSLKGGAGAMQVSLEDVPALEGPRKRQDVVALDEALTKLEEVDARAARVVELKFFAGMTDEQAAQTLAVSTATVRRDWTFARAWLFEQVKRSG
jgi:RNA polymerase sigma factor (TIGR02999 family)